jgi:hypothetical protein
MLVHEVTSERAAAGAVLAQAVALLEAEGVSIPVVEGRPALTHQIVGGLGVEGLHLFRLAAGGPGGGSARWRAVLDAGGNVLDMLPITTGERKRLRCLAKAQAEGWEY